MAVSRGKMLGHYTRGPGGYRCFCCKDPHTARWRKRVEARELAAELAPDGEDPEWLAALDPLIDASDCAHGCNGDCFVSGSGRCTFACHEAAAPGAC